MPSKIIIGVMGPGENATSENCVMAYQLGKLIAREGWVTLSGGRNVGVMDAVSRGAQEAGGLTVGILPGDHHQHTSNYIDLPVLTGMGSARNNINILTANIVVSCGIGPGTLSEIALAIKAKKDVIFFGLSRKTAEILYELSEEGTCHEVNSADEAIDKIKQLLKKGRVSSQE